jgi:ribosomal protein S3AE
MLPNSISHFRFLYLITRYVTDIMVAQLKYSILLADLLKSAIRRNTERILTHSLIKKKSLQVTLISL